MSFALWFDGRKRVLHADEAMARITAERLVAHLERSGYVLLKKPRAEHDPIGTGRFEASDGVKVDMFDLPASVPDEELEAALAEMADRCFRPTTSSHAPEKGRWRNCSPKPVSLGKDFLTMRPVECIQRGGGATLFKWP